MLQPKSFKNASDLHHYLVWSGTPSIFATVDELLFFGIDFRNVIGRYFLDGSGMKSKWLILRFDDRKTEFHWRDKTLKSEEFFSCLIENHQEDLDWVLFNQDQICRIT